MKPKRTIFILLAVIMLASLVGGSGLADDSITFRRNISRTPEGETEDAGIAFMPFYLPAQMADGSLTTVEYITEDGTTALTSDYARPLIAVYIDDIGEHEEEEEEMSGISSGLGFGMRDIFIAHSLDDGATWKQINVSRGAHLSSFILENGHEYPGDTYAGVMSVAGNRVMAAWLSRYCEGGIPLYTMSDDDAYTDAMQTTYGLPDLYMQDIWGVTGSQKSVDYTDQGFPEVGEVPYGCVWTARGTLVQDADTGVFDIAWTNAERLTSGVRDPNRLEVDGVQGAGFVLSWQEDPEGLRPGQGLGPGEGWSGAIVNAKTDIWYSYIDWDHFGLVDTDGDPLTVDEATPMEEYLGDTQPKPAVPMSMPVRLTDNNMCKYTDGVTASDDYCHADIDTVAGTIEYPSLGTPALCETSYTWDTPDGNSTTTVTVCEASDGRILNGRVGASRPRISLQPYDQDGDGLNDSAWYIMAYEETKALGDIVDAEEDPIEIGKNIWYHTFDMFHPEVIEQGGMLNQPSAFNPETLEEAPAGEFLTLEDEFAYTVYQTEIARRFSFMAQPVAKIGATRTSAYLLYKQGILNQGGPADIFSRRIVVPDELDLAVDNPYLYKYMACDEWLIPADGTSDNPNYLEGLCAAPATNLSATTNDLCYTTASTLDGEPSQECVDDFPWEGGVDDFPKVAVWDQFEDNLDDQSWENPFDVAKGHRGFIDGDFVMILYAWSPNWKANSVGNDKYNLYIRRSFDGGQTWTTTPAELGGTGISDSILDPSLCENFGLGGQDVTTVCYTYGAGEFERARNVSQLIGTKITILDPRYTPTGGLKKWVVAPYVDEYLDTSAYTIADYDLYRDPSKYFVVFETGDNTTAAEGEPVPMDLFYSRATVYGDIYEWEYVEPTSTVAAEYRWPWLEKQLDELSGEAAITSNPSGDFMYADWNQWREDEEEVVTDSDVWFRRLFYNTWIDAAPTAWLISVPQPVFDLNSELVLIGNAKDNDQFGSGESIVEYEWTMDGEVVSSDRYFKAPPRTLSKGWHGFGFRAKDHEGHWSNTVSFEIFVAETVYRVQMPSILMDK